MSEYKYMNEYEKHPQLYGCVIRIYDVHTDEMVWKIGVHIDDGHF